MDCNDMAVMLVPVNVITGTSVYSKKTMCYNLSQIKPSYAMSTCPSF